MDSPDLGHFRSFYSIEQPLYGTKQPSLARDFVKKCPKTGRLSVWVLGKSGFPTLTVFQLKLAILAAK